MKQVAFVEYEVYLMMFFGGFDLQVVYTPGQKDNCFLCGQAGHLAAECEGKPKRKRGEFDEKGGEDEVLKMSYQVQ